MEFKGKYAVITGATSGIGLDLLKRLTRVEGCHVCAVGRSHEKLAAISARYGVKTIACDLKIPEQVDDMFRELFTSGGDWGGRVDIFIANAGMAYYEWPDPGTDWGHIEDIFAIDAVSPLYTLFRMQKYSGDRTFQYVMMISGVAHMPIPGYALYSAAKAALDAFVKSYRGTKPENMILSAVYPVAVKTPFYRNGGMAGRVPLVRQSRRSNAERVLEGIRLNRPEIYPSRFFVAVMALTRLFPPLARLYRAMELQRLRRWRTENAGRQGRSGM